jgi:hypothetical protein
MKEAIIKKSGDTPIVAIINNREYPVKNEFDFKLFAHQTYFKSMPKESYLDVVSALAKGIQVDTDRIEIEEFDCEKWCTCTPCIVNCQEPELFAILKPETK